MSIFPHWVDVLFLFSQFYIVHIHRQEPFLGLRISIPNLELFPNHVQEELS